MPQPPNIISGYNIIKDPNCHILKEYWCINKSSDAVVYGMLAEGSEPNSINADELAKRRPSHFVPYDLTTGELKWADRWPLGDELYTDSLRHALNMARLINNHDKGYAESDAIEIKSDQSDNMLAAAQHFLAGTDEGRQLIESTIRKLMQKPAQTGQRPANPTPHQPSDKFIIIDDDAVANILRTYIANRFHMPENSLYVGIHHTAPTKWFARVECMKWNLRDTLIIINLLHELHGLQATHNEPIITQQLGEIIIKQALQNRPGILCPEV